MKAEIVTAEREVVATNLDAEVTINDRTFFVYAHEAKHSEAEIRAEDDGDVSDEENEAIWFALYEDADQVKKVSDPSCKQIDADVIAQKIIDNTDVFGSDADDLYNRVVDTINEAQQ